MMKLDRDNNVNNQFSTYRKRGMSGLAAVLQKGI